MENIFLKFSTNISFAKSILVREKIKTLLDAHSAQLVETAEEASILVLVNSLASSQDLGKKFIYFESVIDLNEDPNAISKILSTTTIVSKADTIDTSIRRKIIAVTACPTGVAHTFMSAEAIENYALNQGYEIKVETRGQQGVGNAITEQEIAEAELVIAAIDIEVDLSKFAGKKVYRTSTGAMIKKPQEEFNKAFTQATVLQASSSKAQAPTTNNNNILSHLLTGVSYMLPLVIAGGILIAISFIFGIEAFNEKDSFAASLMQIGGGSAFHLMIAVFSGYVAYSIADRPGLAPGLIGGLIATVGGSGFLGGIVAGLLAGYVTRYLARVIKLPDVFASMKPIIILPVLSVLITGLVMIYVINPPVSSLNTSLTEFLKDLSGSNAVILGLIIGAMMCFDLGGPVNKAAYATSLGLMASQVNAPIAIAMAAGMVPPIGMFIATVLAKRKFTAEQISSGKAALLLGGCFISEAAIPFAAADPARVIPVNILGGAVTGMLVGFIGTTLPAPHGGIFVIWLTSTPILYILSILAGAFVTGVIYAFIKPTPHIITAN